MISLDGVSWHPRCDPEVEIPKRDILSTHVGKEGESRSNLGNHLQNFQRMNLCLPIKKQIERKFSDKHRSTPLLGNNEPKPENKSIPLPDHTQQKYDNPPLPANTEEIG